MVTALLKKGGNSEILDPGVRYVELFARRKFSVKKTRFFCNICIAFV